MTSGEQIAYLSPPHADRQVFTRNFIRGSIVELNFPTIISFDKKLAGQFGNHVRKEFPHFSTSYSASLADSGISPGKDSFTFESRKKGNAAISLHESKMNLQISKYTSFEDFERVVENSLEALNSVLDTEFFTRIGYRIINAVPVPNKKEEIPKYINHSLVAPMNNLEFGTNSSNIFEIRGLVNEQDSYTFKYGVPGNQATSKNANRGDIDFMLDFDYQTNDIDSENCVEKMRYFHNVHFPFFWWTLGVKARQYLQSKS